MGYYNGGMGGTSGGGGGGGSGFTYSGRQAFTVAGAHVIQITLGGALINPYKVWLSAEVPGEDALPNLSYDIVDGSHFNIVVSPFNGTVAWGVVQ